MIQPPIIISLLVLGSMLMLLATVMLFTAWAGKGATFFAINAMLFCAKSNAASFSNESLIFWAVATCIIIAVDFLQPKAIAKSRVGAPYICGGTIVGMVLGMLTNTMAGIITASALGAFAGALAFSRTPAGRDLPFPSYVFFNTLASKGLPAIVTMSMVGAALVQLIS